LSQFDIKKGDRIYVKISHDIRNGAEKYGQNMLEGKYAVSDMHVVQSSGVMHIKVTKDNVEKWCEGQVWVNVDGVWKEATDVYVNV
jgi:hypothetical protein